MTRIRQRWDIFARVIDNYGDAGVSWRLARLLAAEHGRDVTLWIDAVDALARIAPELESEGQQRVHGVTVRRWEEPFAAVSVADVVIEAFGCGLPDAYASRLAGSGAAARWFVLEYLSAEAWVDNAHGLPSPHPILPVTRRFWFPGFTTRSGGLLRERDLLIAREQFQSSPSMRTAWWDSMGIAAPPENGIRVSMFCYPGSPLGELLDIWADGDTPVVCIVPVGVATGTLDAWTGGAVPHAGGDALERGRLRLQVIPFLAQDAYDRLLWACDVNFVRGEDSFVRAQWAARPFVWQLYPQEGHAHFAKLAAFMDRYVEGLEPADALAMRSMAEAWNGAPGAPSIGPAWLAFAAAHPHLSAHAPAWATSLARLPELAQGLVNEGEQ